MREYMLGFHLNVRLLFQPWEYKARGCGAIR